MHSAMEQAKYWMWTRRKFPVRPLYESVRPMPIPATSLTASQATSFYNESWEEKVFAEDSAGLLGGCVWPPRSYTCSFCGREFRSAQALGGHMNVHRRDRARLKQSCIAGEDDHDDLRHLTALPNTKPTPKPLLNTLGFEVSLARDALYSPLSLQMVDDVDYSGARSLLKVVPELKLWGEELIVGSKRRLIEENELQSNSSKRKKMNQISIYTDEEVKVSGAEVINLSSETVEELDLELRLGDMHQV